MTLFKSELSDHLTQPDPTVTQMARHTMPGMAHFAGTGPHGKTCRECQFWGIRDRSGRSMRFDYFSKTGNNHGLIKSCPCEKFKELMWGEAGKSIPDYIASCKYFEQAEHVPDRFAK